MNYKCIQCKFNFCTDILICDNCFRRAKKSYDEDTLFLAWGLLILSKYSDSCIMGINPDTGRFQAGPSEPPFSHGNVTADEARTLRKLDWEHFDCETYWDFSVG